MLDTDVVAEFLKDKFVFGVAAKDRTLEVLILALQQLLPDNLVYVLLGAAEKLVPKEGAPEAEPKYLAMLLVGLLEMLPPGFQDEQLSEAITKIAVRH